MVEDGVLVSEVVEDFLVGEDDMMQLEMMVSLSVFFFYRKEQIKGCVWWRSVVGVHGDGGAMLLLLSVATKYRKMIRKKCISAYVCRNDMKSAVSGLWDHYESALLVRGDSVAPK